MNSGPSATFHEQQALKNYNFLNSFWKDYAYNDWAVTVSFYICVHIIEYYITAIKKVTYVDGSRHEVLGIRSSSELCRKLSDLKIEKVGDFDTHANSQHIRRNIVVLGCIEFKEIRGQFINLYHKSKDARYEDFKCLDTHLNILLGSEFNPILTWANDKLGMNFKLLPIPTTP